MHQEAEGGEEGEYFDSSFILLNFACNCFIFQVHTLVLLCIFPARVVLINHHGLKLAEFPAESIRFCGVYADDRRFFGLVTAQQREGEASLSSSCHVFMVEQVSECFSS